MSSVQIEVSPGEVMDKITILEIKRERIDDEGKRRNVEYELSRLESVGRRLAALADLAPLVTELKEINTALWDIEDEIRDCERCRDFGRRFIELARSVYHTNDRRSAVKRRINEALGSKLVEEKSYAAY